MSIQFNEEKKSFSLRTNKSLYMIQVDGLGYLRHIYYGKNICEEDLAYTIHTFDLGFSGNPYELRKDRIGSMDLLPLEFSSYGNGDYRICALRVQMSDGSVCADLKYDSHEIKEEKYSLDQLPASFDNGNECQTLIITLKDDLSSFYVKLYYGVFEKQNVITRAVEYCNLGSESVILEKADSVCLDLPFGNWDMMHFHGRHLLERQPERLPVPHFIAKVGSDRGTSSHQHNPFIILCDHEANEDHGDCYGLMFVYSGSFEAEIERSQINSVRIVMGISSTDFSWRLQPGNTFTAPEVIMAHADGLTALSHIYHRMIRHNVTRGEYALSHRPVLINSWEATYFDIRTDKILALATEAKALGMELFVLDDGWFRGRNDDNAGLGDWFENTEKLPEGLGSLINEITSLGLKFGIWIEPEMINEDSDLYRAHPDWAFTIPGRKPVMGRNQLVLDMTRDDVRDYLFEVFFDLLKKHDISYVKWDMNRSLANVFSRQLPADRQGEVQHRYVLGVYDLADRLVTAFPHVLFEGCSGGGGRFDAGMLYYSPQIWCSDDTDPIERLMIQNGTSYGYPVSTMGSHVSASPNHQTARPTPIATRAITAMSGTFGYELDLSKLTEIEKDEVAHQIIQFCKDEPILHDGLYYRLSDSGTGKYYAWMMVAEDQSAAIVNLVLKDSMMMPPMVHLSLKGLDADARYLVEEDGHIHSGNALMHAGYTFPELPGDYAAVQLHLIRQD